MLLAFDICLLKELSQSYTKDPKCCTESSPISDLSLCPSVSSLSNYVTVLLLSHDFRLTAIICIFTFSFLNPVREILLFCLIFCRVFIISQ